MTKSYRNLTFILIIQIIVVHFLSFFPEFIEKYYSNGLYEFLSKIFRTIFGWIPFSIGDVFYFVLILFAIKFIYEIFKNKEQSFKEIFYKIGASFSIIYFFFYIMWGLNYSRNSLDISMQLKKNEYNINEITTLSHKLLNRLKIHHNNLAQHDTLAVQILLNKEEIIKITPNGYENLAKNLEQFEYRPTSLKKSLFSLPLTYMGFAGYYNPFSGEAQVDYLIPKISLPVTCSHEIAHQLGIASESEANFIGFLAASQNDNEYFKYAAYLMAYRYALYDLAKKDIELFKEFKNNTPIGILKNIKEVESFWTDYENPFEPVFKTFYDNYLKANKQKEGIASYSRIIDLLLAYDLKYSL